MEQLYAAPFQLRAIGLAARPDEIIETDQRVRRASLGKRAGNGAPHKAADSGDQNTHRAQHAKNNRCGKREVWRLAWDGGDECRCSVRRAESFRRRLDAAV